MIGTTLADLRRHIESLADPAGEFRLVCARTGDRPVPADGLAFDSRASARAAARSTEQYRAALRRYDPQLPVYDVIACQVTSRVTGAAGPAHRSTRGGGSEPPSRADRTGNEATVPSSIDYSHTVAGVVFEAIADSSHTAVQDAIMDTYLESADKVDAPDELCLRLLRSIADELAARLDAADVADVLRAAGRRMPPIGADRRDPLAGVLDRLQSIGLVRSYDVSAASIDVDTDERRWRVELEGYALAEDDRVVTLPVVVALFRRRWVQSIAVDSADRAEHGAWTLTVAANRDGSVAGLTSVRPRP